MPRVRAQQLDVAGTAGGGEAGRRGCGEAGMLAGRCGVCVQELRTVEAVGCESMARRRRFVEIEPVVHCE